jgi:hypothetical protein
LHRIICQLMATTQYFHSILYPLYPNSIWSQKGHCHKSCIAERPRKYWIIPSKYTLFGLKLDYYFEFSIVSIQNNNLIINYKW